MQIQQYLGTQLDTPISVKANQIQTTVYGITENFFKINEIVVWEGATKTFQGFYQELVRLLEIIEVDENLEKSSFIC